jgi:hypothetical protein
MRREIPPRNAYTTFAKHFRPRLGTSVRQQRPANDPRPAVSDALSTLTRGNVFSFGGVCTVRKS